MAEPIELLWYDLQTLLSYPMKKRKKTKEKEKEKVANNWATGLQTIILYNSAQIWAKIPPKEAQF